jgi:hypothetical protein
MDLPQTPHPLAPLSPVVHQPPTLNLRFDTPRPDLPGDEPPVNFKSYFNTL